MMKGKILFIKFFNIFFSIDEVIKGYFFCNLKFNIFRRI